MNIFKRIWAWLVGTKKQDKEACVRNFEKEYEEFYMKQVKADWGKEGVKYYGRVNTRPTTTRPDFIPPPQNPTRHFNRNSDDNFMLGAVVGYVVADSLNTNTSYRNVEENKSSSCESSYTPSSSSSYNSGSYCSSSDSGSSSFSCDSVGC